MKVQISNNPADWGIATKSISSTGEAKGMHLSGAPDAPMVFESSMKIPMGEVDKIMSVAKSIVADAKVLTADKFPDRGYSSIEISIGDKNYAYLYDRASENSRIKLVELWNLMAKLEVGAW